MERDDTTLTAVAESGTLAFQKARLTSMYDADMQYRLCRVASQELNARLAQERRLDAASLARVHTTWRTIMRLAQTEDLRAQLEVFSRGFERDYERACARVSAVLGELQEAEDMRLMAYRQHARAMDDLITLFKRRVDDLHASTRASASSLVREFALERAAHVAAHKAAKTELMHVVRAVREQEDRVRADAEADHNQAVQTFRKASADRLHSMHSEMDAATEALERAFEDAHSKYLSTTESRTAEVKSLHVLLQGSQEHIRRNAYTIARLEKKQAWWETRLLTLARSEGDRLSELEEQCVSTNADMRAIKLSFGDLQRQAKARLVVLASAVSDTRMQLSERVHLAQRLLETAEISRGLEGLHTRIAPLQSASRTTTTMEGMQKLDDTTVKEEAVSVFVRGVLGMAGDAGDTVERSAPRMSPPRVTEQVNTVQLPDSPTAAGSVAKPVNDGGSLVSVPMENSLKARIADTLGEYLEEADTLDRFYRRVGLIEMELAALEAQQHQLQASNAALRATIADVLRRIAVTPEAVDAPNPLLVVNGATGILPEKLAAMRKDARVVPTRPPAFVEAGHVYATQTRHQS